MDRSAPHVDAPIAPWLRPMLWRERDWGQALARIAAAVAVNGPDSARRARELGRALEYVAPDRRQAIVAYASGGDVAELARARDLAAELGWWAAVARLAGAARAQGGDARLAVDEFWAWLDAGEPMLAAMVAAPAIAAAPDDTWLARVAAVVRGQPAAAAAAAAADQTDLAAVLASVRLARLAGDDAVARAQLQAAFVRAPHAPRLAALWLGEALDDGELTAAVHAQLAEREPAAWIATATSLGHRLVARAGARGLGLRLLEASLTTAYRHGLVPGAHLATWAVLASHAAAAGRRPSLMALAAAGLDAVAAAPDDRLWLAALGAEIAWRDAGALDVARAWAAIVAELAHDHPLLDELARAPSPTAAAGGADDDGLGYLDDSGARGTGGGPLHTALDALRQAVAAAEAPVDVDIDTADLLEPEPAPAAAVEVLTSAVDAAAAAVATIAAAPPPSLIPSAARTALGRIPGRLPPLPPLRRPPNPVPRAPRVAVPLDATVERAGHPPLTVVCRDVSTTGVFVLTDAALTLDAAVELILRTPGDEAWTQARHRVAARVVRRETNGYGLELTTPTPELRAALAQLTGV